MVGSDNFLRLIYRKWTGGLGLQNKQNREDWLCKALARIPNGARILDAGAGELQYKNLCNHLVYVSQDFGQYNGTGNGVGLQTREWNQNQLDIICDIVDIPEPDVSFDAIMCIEVLEHLPDPLAALKEFSRLLKPGGFLILTAPFCSLTHFAPHFYYSGFSEYFWRYHLPRYEFEIAELTSNGNYFEYLSQELRRLPHFLQKRKDAWSVKLLAAILMNTLAPYSQQDSESDRLLAFGWHIFAQKSRPREGWVGNSFPNAP